MVYIELTESLESLYASAVTRLPRQPPQRLQHSFEKVLRDWVVSSDCTVFAKGCFKVGLRSLLPIVTFLSDLSSSKETR